MSAEDEEKPFDAAAWLAGIQKEQKVAPFRPTAPRKRKPKKDEGFIVREKRREAKWWDIWVSLQKADIRIGIQELKALSRIDRYQMLAAVDRWTVRYNEEVERGRQKNDSSEEREDLQNMQGPDEE